MREDTNLVPWCLYVGIEAGSEMVLPFHQTQIAIAKSRSGTASWWNEVQSVNVRSMSDWNQQKFDCADLL